MSDENRQKRVKVLFRVPREDGGEEVESLWATPVEDGYQLDNIPFCASSIACGDIVATKSNDDGALEFESLVQESGHSTIRLWFANADDVKQVRDNLRVLGCTSELDLSRLVAVDIPPEVPYALVLPLLEAGKDEGVFEYEEACLAQDK